MIQQLSRFKWLPAIVVLLGGIFLFAVPPQPVEAAQNCTYTYNADKSSIRRSNCTVNLNDATFAEVDNPSFDKSYTYASGDCRHTIIIRDDKKPTQGQLNVGTGCQDRSQDGAITIKEVSELNPEEVLSASLQDLIRNNGCKQEAAVGGSVSSACFEQYAQWVDACHLIAMDAAENASGNKNDAYEERFARCLSNRSSNKLTENQIKNALPNDIYDQLKEAGTVKPPGNNDETCESTGGALAWLFCPVLQMIDGAAGTLTDLVEETLYVDEDKYESESLANSWRSMRNIALLILVPMMLFMVIGTALEFGPFDAYTVKKALPRMFIAVMFIVLSLEITQFFVNLSNLIGRGIEGLILASTNNPESLKDFYGDAGGAVFSYALLGGALVGIGTGAITLGIVGSLAFVTFLALLIAYLVLVLRELLILALIMISPLAILVWIFPGNDKLWKIWKTTFTAMLMMFPLIILLITSGKVFAGLIDETQGNFTAFFLKIIAFVAPFFLIPATFKYGLGIFGNLAGMVNDRSRGIFDRQRKFREGSRGHARQMAQAGNRFGSLNKFATGRKINRGIQGAVNAPSAIAAGGLGSNWRTSVRTNLQNTDLAEVERNMKENAAYQPWMYNDDVNRIASEATNATDLRNKLKNLKDKDGNYVYTAQGVEDMASRVESVRRTMGADAFRIMTTRQAIAGGTAYESADQVWEAAARAAGNNDAAAESLVANGRSEGMKAGRIDYAGAGFGKTLGTVNEFRQALKTGGVTNQMRQRLNAEYHQAVMESQGGSSLVHSSMKQSAIEQMAPEMLDSIRRSSGDERKYIQSIASVAAVYDGMQGSSPQKARVIANAVLGQKINAQSLYPSMDQSLRSVIERQADEQGNITVQQAIEGLRSNTAFVEMRREYGREIDDIRGRSQPNPSDQPNPTPGQA